MQAMYKVVLIAGSRPNGVKQFGSEAEKQHFIDCWQWLQQNLGSKIKYKFWQIGAVAALLTEEEATELILDPRILLVEKSVSRKQTAIQKEATWGLANICGRLDSRYEYENTGKNIPIYIVDSGIDITHPEFENRAIKGFDIDSSLPINWPHGTHVAGIVGSKTYGVAKKATLVDVRVMIEGSGTSIDIIAGLSWILSQHVENTPGVINLSFGGDVDTVEESTIQALITDGLICVAAAGNDAIDATTVSPARMSEVITVGAIDSANALASFSNTGVCVDLLAPGVDILSTLLSGATGRLSGTSMACPFVAGVIACYVEDHTAATAAEVLAELKTQAQLDKSTHIVPDTTKDVVKSKLTRVWLGSTGAVAGLSPFKQYKLKSFVLSGETRIYQDSLSIENLSANCIVQKLGVKMLNTAVVKHDVPSMMPGLNPEAGE